MINFKLFNDNFTFGLNAAFSSGFITEVAKYTLSSSGSNSYAGTCNFYGAVNNNGYISVSPGTVFAPGPGGIASLKVTTCN